jgi:hypothetical protein
MIAPPPPLELLLEEPADPSPELLLEEPSEEALEEEPPSIEELLEEALELEPLSLGEELLLDEDPSSP